jgi:hypothetical protein
VFWTVTPIAAVAGCTDTRTGAASAQVFLAVESVRLEYIGYASIETLDHAIGTWRSGLG